MRILEFQGLFSSHSSTLMTINRSIKPSIARQSERHAIIQSSGFGTNPKSFYCRNQIRDRLIHGVIGNKQSILFNQSIAKNSSPGLVVETQKESLRIIQIYT